MKKLPIILSSISLVGVIVALIVVFSGKNSQSEGHSNSGNGEPSDLKIAYILTDSVLVNYELSIDLQENFHDEQQKFNLDFGKKREDLEKQAIAFQEKLQRGGFLSQDRAMKERDRLLGQEEEMKRLDYEYSTKLAEMEATIQKQIADSIVSFVKTYNEKQKYTYIFSNTGTIIVGDQQFNITKDILDGLNARYVAAQKP